MKEEYLKICNIPTVIYGENAKKAFLFVHGKCGNKEEGKLFAKFAVNKGYQVIAIDLPEHGERKNDDSDKIRFLPWQVVPELQNIMRYLKSRYEIISLRANSIGAYFSMLAFSGEKLESSLFVSPIVDMKALMFSMMKNSDVTEERLKAEGEIQTEFGETFSYKYLEYARNNSYICWQNRTSILYGENDSMTEYETIKAFVREHNASLVVMPNGEHWFHTEDELNFLAWWTEREII